MGMKKMAIRPTLSFLIALLLTIGAFAKGGDAPRVEITQVASTKQVTLTVEGLSSQAEIEVRAEDGVVLMEERFRGQSSIERLLNLEQLPTGRYLIVVATRVGGNSELIEHGVTGLLIPPRDPSALAAAICSLLQDPDSAVRLGRTARQRVSQHYSLRAMSDRFESFYEHLMRGATKTDRRRTGRGRHA